MSDDAQDQVIAERGLRAEAFLQSELLIEANKILAKRIVDKFAQTNPRDEKELAYLRRVLQAQADFNDYFAEIIRLGENAQARIRDNERRSLLSRLVA